MGRVKSLSHNQFPRQSKHLGKRVDVCFHYDTSHVIHGTIVREDAEAPFEMIIALDDGRYVLDAECQYRLSDN